MVVASEPDVTIEAKQERGSNSCVLVAPLLTRYNHVENKKSPTEGKKENTLWAFPGDARKQRQRK